MARSRKPAPFFSALIIVLAIIVAAPAISNSLPAQATEPTEAYFLFDGPPHPETFIVKLTDPVKIERARDIISGKAKGIITGTIIRQPVYYNAPWHFYLDTKTISFPEVATEVCDSSIKGIEDHLDTAYPTWCPWTVRLLGEIPAPSKPGAGNLAPAISMTQPYIDNQPRTIAPATIMLIANADDADGTISKVEFFEGGKKLGEDRTYPYNLSWSGVLAGSYLLSARATDNEGAIVSSKSITFTVDVGTSNPVDQTAFFVRQHYIDFLGREPDAPGYQGWQNILNNCGQSGKDANGNFCDRIEVSSDFFRSEEFQTRGYFIYRLYSAALGRNPQYNEFIPDMARVSGFLSPQELEAAKIAFINDLMARTEFRSRYEALTDPTAYVDAILNTAAVTLPRRQTIIDDLAQGRKTRAETLRVIVETAEVYQKYYNTAFVIMQYFGYLRRDPDILYLDWIKTMDRTGDYRTMINGFVNAAEYRKRFGP